MNSIETKAAFRIWLEAKEIGHLLRENEADFRSDYDPERVIAKGCIDVVIAWSWHLKLHTAYRQFALDVAKVVAPLSTEAWVPTALAVAQRRVDNKTPKKKATDAEYEEDLYAVDASYRVAFMVPRRATGDHGLYWSLAAVLSALYASVLRAEVCVFRGTHNVGGTTDAARWAAEGSPLLIHQLDAIEACFRTDVYNALMVELEQINQTAVDEVEALHKALMVELEKS